MTTSSSRTMVIAANRRPTLIFLCIGLGLLALVCVYWQDLSTGLKIGGSLIAGVFLLSVPQLVRPAPFAVLNETGIAFPILRIQPIAWDNLITATSGPRCVQGGDATVVMFRPPLVLHLRSFQLPWYPAKDGEFFKLPDGTVQRLLDTTMCSVPTETLIEKITAFSASNRTAGERTANGSGSEN